MTVHVICLSVAGGLPLFTRKRGDGEMPPFSMVAALNGVHMFGMSQSMVLKSTDTQETTVVWSEFEESIILIGSACGTSEIVLNRLLTSIFRALVLLVGIDELRNPRNAEILKRELRACTSLVDFLIECVGVCDGAVIHSDLIGMSQTMLCQENQLLQNCMDSFAECCDSLYGCLLIHGQITVATASWWQLEPDERKLLALFISSSPSATARDTPVFLPCKSPNVPFRLVCCTLMAGVEICLLCGPTPSLAQVEEIAAQCWQSISEILLNAEQCHPWNLPPTIQLETGIMGVLLVDTVRGKFVISRNQTSAPRRDTFTHSSTHRLDVLRTFYYQISSTVFNDEPDGKQAALETYWCSEYHKCHALRQGPNILCMLYESAVPAHAMRIITQQTLKLLTTDRQLCWTTD